MLKVGDKVRLFTDNERLHGALAVVKQLTEWGAFVATAAAATGEYRALFAEMVPYAQVNGQDRAYLQARDSGYTGDTCNRCGSLRMTRSGACLKCEDCGESGGCS